MALIFDTESDGFLENATKLHCLVAKETETGEVFSFYGDSIKDGVKMLQEYQGTLVAHNGIKHDLPLIQKLYPWFTDHPSKFFDTLVCTRLIWNNIGDTDDARIQQGKLPEELWGSQSLEAWGYRLGKMKGEYSKEFKEKAGKDYKPGDEWKEFSQEMLDYCVQDVEVTAVLYDRIMKKCYSRQAIELEHSVAFICAAMERTGCPFDVPKATALYAELAQKRDAILRQMKETFEPEVIKRVSEKTGKPLKDKVIEFNPGSRKQIADRLIRKYGWKPKDFTPNGQPKVDETILEKLSYPEAKVLTEFFMLEKRLGQLAEGDNAWLKLERNGKIHGSINPGGANGGRATHMAPNLSQIPATDKPYGTECRSLYTVPPGWKMVDSDLSGLELRCLAHFMHKYDNGEYGRIVVDGKSSDGTDVHSVNQRAAGLETRAQAKTLIYAFLYGGGDAKLGSILGKGAKEGKALKERFLAATPALKQLRDAVGKAAKRGYLIGLDGRHLHVRSEHSALNLLLQSAGALISKRWLIETQLMFKEQGIVCKEDWSGNAAMLFWIHDQETFAVREGLEDTVGKICVEAARRAGDYFNFKCPVDAAYSTGNNFSEVH